MVENFPDKLFTKMINKQLDIKIEQFTQEFNLVQRKINKKAASLNEIPPEIWKTRKFNDLLL